MPEPTLSDIHVDPALTDFSVAYFQDEAKFVAPSIFPRVDVAKRSAKYYTYDLNELRRSDMRKRAPGTESAVRTYKLSKDDYYAEVYSIAVDVSEQERANADPALDPEEDAARVVAQDIAIGIDKKWTAAAFSTGIWGTESTGTWNTSTGDPIGDIQTGVLTMLEETGFRPNVLALGAESWYGGLWSSTQLLDRLATNVPQIVTPQLIKDLFMFDSVYILDSVEFTGDEGTTGTPEFIHQDHALLAYVNPTAGLRDATAGKTFMWTGLTGGGSGIRTKRLEMPWKDAMPRVESDVAFDFKVVASDLGYMIKNTVS